MDKRFFYTLLYMCIFLAVASCSDSKKDNHQGEHKHVINPMVEQLDETPDNALYVTLLRADADSMYVKDNITNKSMAFNYINAKNSGMFKGSLKTGNTYSVFPDNKTASVVIAINTTELSGRWFYDMKQHRGFRFEERGALSSLNAETISYREWKLLNGKLYFYFVDMQQAAEDRHEYQVEEAEILKLSAKKLTLKFHGRTLNCQRQEKLIRIGE